MKSTIFALVAALAAQEVAGHATFQDLWINGADQICLTTCVRLPLSNSPVQNVMSNDVRCNQNSGAVAGRCGVKAGDTLTVEMHQQGGDRSCASDGIGGAHYGPVHVYLSQVADSRTADGSTGFFKIYADTWAKDPSGYSGDDDYWGTKDLNLCCGKVTFTLPSDIPAGDYLMRAEVIALHAASSSGGAQLYMSCYQLTVSGGGSASPALVKFPGAYAASDPGILINIHAPMSTYVDPGPTVYSGGQLVIPKNTCSGLSASPTGPLKTGTPYTPGSGGSPTTSTAPAGGNPTTQPSTMQTSTKSSAQPTTTSASTGGCTVAKYGQCGGTGFTGCTTCAAGSTCKGSGYYYQCQ